MKYNPEIHHRRSIRLRGYDYSNTGAYFVTICVKNKDCLFGEITNRQVVLDEYGNIAHMCWHSLTDNYSHIELDSFIIMPNHLHGIMILNSRGLINQTPTINHPASNQNPDWILMKNAQHTLGKIIRHFKAKTTKYIRDKGLNYFQWQRNYFERIIRNEYELQRIREYIINNPFHWHEDEYNPANYK